MKGLQFVLTRGTIINGERTRMTKQRVTPIGHLGRCRKAPTQLGVTIGGGLKEAAVRRIFDSNPAGYGYAVLKSQEPFPDYELLDLEAGRVIRAEAESWSSRFIHHGHDIAQCDLIICWLHNTTFPIPVLELFAGNKYAPNEPSVIYKQPRPFVEYMVQMPRGHWRPAYETAVEIVALAEKYNVYTAPTLHALTGYHEQAIRDVLRNPGRFISDAWRLESERLKDALPEKLKQKKSA